MQYCPSPSLGAQCSSTVSSVLSDLLESRPKSLTALMYIWGRGSMEWRGGGEVGDNISMYVKRQGVVINEAI